MSNQTNNRLPSFGGLSPNELKSIVERCVTRLLVVLLECLTPVRSNTCRRNRAATEMEHVVKDLQAALQRLRK